MIKKIVYGIAALSALMLFIYVGLYMMSVRSNALGWVLITSGVCIFLGSLLYIVGDTSGKNSQSQS